MEMHHAVETLIVLIVPYTKQDRLHLALASKPATKEVCKDKTMRNNIFLRLYNSCWAFHY